MTAPGTIRRRGSRPSRVAAVSAAVGAAAVAVGCSVLTSDLIEDVAARGKPAVGVYYSLPVSVVDASLYVVDATAEFILMVEEPRSIADPYHRYLLRYRPLPNYNDIIDVSVNDKSFLTVVSSTTTDETPFVILNIFKAFTALGGGLEAGTVPSDAKKLATVTFNPTDASDLARALDTLNGTLADYSRKSVEPQVCPEREPKNKSKAKGKAKPKAKPKVVNGDGERGYCARKDENGGDRDGDGDGGKYDMREIAACYRFRELKKAVDRWCDLGSMRWDKKSILQSAPVFFFAKRAEFLPQKHPAEPQEYAYVPAPAANCKVGLCYRPRLPYAVAYGVGVPPALGGPSERGKVFTYFMMPNEADLVEIDIRRAFFVQKIQKMEFEDGYLKYMEVKKKSELEAIASLPVQIISAMLEAVQIRVKLVETQINEAGALKDLIEARAALREQRQQLEAAVRLNARDPARATGTTALPLAIKEQKPDDAPPGLQTIRGVLQQ